MPMAYTPERIIRISPDIIFEQELVFKNSCKIQFLNAQHKGGLF